MVREDGIESLAYNFYLLHGDGQRRVGQRQALEGAVLEVKRGPVTELVLALDPVLMSSDERMKLLDDADAQRTFLLDNVEDRRLQVIM